MMKRGLIIWGGWNGHTPERLADRLKGLLEVEDYSIDSTSHFGALLDEDLPAYDVIVPIWSCGVRSKPYMRVLLECIGAGTGFASFHGGINWFEDEEYYSMMGGSYIEDRRPVEFTVKISDQSSPITSEVESFNLEDELYFVQIDPTCKVLCSTRFEGTEIPITWTKSHGDGRVFYTSLAHEYSNATSKEVTKLIVNGIKWATRN
ncbi:MAG: hypothetical protein GKR89_01860 [Candidatus Latescibacteria bacterium]|nr:hypothetical protein [Candidatus Latescibacterota bacterium]